MIVADPPYKRPHPRLVSRSQEKRADDRRTGRPRPGQHRRVLGCAPAKLTGARRGGPQPRQGGRTEDLLGFFEQNKASRLCEAGGETPGQLIRKRTRFADAEQGQKRGLPMPVFRAVKLVDAAVALKKPQSGGRQSMASRETPGFVHLFGRISAAENNGRAPHQTGFKP